MRRNISLAIIITGPESVPACVAPRGKFGIVASSTEDERVFGRKLLLHQTDFAPATLEALLVPVEVLVGHVLGVQSNSALANATIMREVLLVAWNATGVFVSENVAIPSQTFVARNAHEMLGVEVFSQGLKIGT